MAVKASRIFTLILLLTLSVASTTAPVWVSSAIASTGSDGSTSGDPDTPWDKCPKNASNPVASSTNSSADVTVSPVEPGKSLQSARWMVVQQLLNVIVGRSGLLR